jgi:hypothetical protein
VTVTLPTTPVTVMVSLSFAVGNAFAVINPFTSIEATLSAEETLQLTPLGKFESLPS